VKKKTPTNNGNTARRAQVRRVSFFQLGRFQLIDQLPTDRRDAEAFIRTKLYTTEHSAGIDIETLMHEAVDECDPEPP
jgi:hypothetical protein